MKFQPDTATADQARHGLWFVDLCPGEPQRSDIQASMDQGVCPEMHVLMEVVDVCPDGRAVLWISDLTRDQSQTPKMTVARLSPCRMAEVLAARAAGRTAAIRLRFEIIGATERGYGAITRDPDGTLEFGAAKSHQDLGMMLGLHISH